MHQQHVVDKCQDLGDHESNVSRTDHAKTMRDLLTKISDFVLPVESRNATQEPPAVWLDKVLAEKLRAHSVKSGENRTATIFFNFSVQKKDHGTR